MSDVNREACVELVVILVVSGALVVLAVQVEVQVLLALVIL